MEGEKQICHLYRLNKQLVFSTNEGYYCQMERRLISMYTRFAKYLFTIAWIGVVILTILFPIDTTCHFKFFLYNGSIDYHRLSLLLWIEIVVLAVYILSSSKRIDFNTTQRIITYAGAMLLIVTSLFTPYGIPADFIGYRPIFDGGNLERIPLPIDTFSLLLHWLVVILLTYILVRLCQSKQINAIPTSSNVGDNRLARK